eukprot:Hpha_TRINITY_DN15746_c0_g1::TRINITY_DN15746_c0_g1_i1::g.39797::m.39797/K06901/pbuG; putative MFS transporter, AGZA family, xanthine/uracil permease
MEPIGNGGDSKNPLKDVGAAGEGKSKSRPPSGESRPLLLPTPHIIEGGGGGGGGGGEPQAGVEAVDVHYPWWSNQEWDAFAGLTCDNIAAQLALIFGLFSIMDPQLIFGRIWPGLGISVLFGNWYYAWQASRLAKKEGRTDVCAQPYGINTPGAFAFMYTIMYGVFYDAQSTKGKTREEAMMLAWRVGAFGTFISGLMEIAAAPFGRRLREILPTPVLMAPLAGVGLVDLAFRGMVDVAREPIPALLPLCIVFSGYFGGVKLGRVPIAVAAIFSGTVIAWVGQFKTNQDVEDGGDWLRDRWRFGDNSTAKVLAFPLVDAMGDSAVWDDVLDYMGTIVPVALINFFCTLEALESAEEAGDAYDTAETLLVDGIGSCVGAFFGSVFGTTVYIGQPAYKRMGGRRGYSIAAGLVVGILGVTGLIAPVYQVLSLGAVRCIIIFVGLTIAAQTMHITPAHQHASVLLGILPVVATYAAPLTDDDVGLRQLADGALLASVCIAAIAYYTVDRRFGPAAAAAAAAAGLSLFGFMHSPAVSARLDRNKHQWHFAVGYSISAVWFLGLRLAQQRGLVEAARGSEV